MSVVPQLNIMPELDEPHSGSRRGLEDMKEVLSFLL